MVRNLGGAHTMAEWPRCLVDLMPRSVGAESVAIIAGVGCCVVEGERGDGKGRVQGGSMANRQTLTHSGRVGYRIFGSGLPNVPNLPNVRTNMA